MQHTDPPIVETHNGILVVRDDLYSGGTKSRIAEELYRYHDEIVYAGSAHSFAQIALATTARKIGKKATIFVAARAVRTHETQTASDLGAKIIEIRPGYLSVVKARATIYCNESGAWLAPLGFDVGSAIVFLAGVAKSISCVPDVVWCAAGSGTLTRALQQAWPDAEHHAVLFGKDSFAGMATEHRHHLSYSDYTKYPTPFPSHPRFDAKAWEICIQNHPSDDQITLFWNVAS